MRTQKKRAGASVFWARIWCGERGERDETAGEEGSGAAHVAKHAGRLTGKVGQRCLRRAPTKVDGQRRPQHRQRRHACNARAVGRAGVSQNEENHSVSTLDAARCTPTGEQNTV